jgi:hypothetical protein
MDCLFTFMGEVMNIIEMAGQAGLKRHQEQAPGIDGVVGNWSDLKAFAELVRADEREACAKVCDVFYCDYCADAIRAGRQA